MDALPDSMRIVVVCFVFTQCGVAVSPISKLGVRVARAPHVSRFALRDMKHGSDAPALWRSPVERIAKSCQDPELFATGNAISG